MGSSMRTVRLVAAAVGLLVWLAAVPVAAGSQSMVVNEIHDIQGAAHLSPFSGQDVSGLEGVVTFKRSSLTTTEITTPEHSKQGGVVEYIVERDDAGSPPRQPEDALGTARVGHQFLSTVRF
jgi:hypothetical protein